LARSIVFTQPLDTRKTVALSLPSRLPILFPCRPSDYPAFPPLRADLASPIQGLISGLLIPISFQPDVPSSFFTFSAFTSSQAPFFSCFRHPSRLHLFPTPFTLVARSPFPFFLFLLSAFSFCSPLRWNFFSLRGRRLNRATDEIYKIVPNPDLRSRLLFSYSVFRFRFFQVFSPLPSAVPYACRIIIIFFSAFWVRNLTSHSLPFSFYFFLLFLFPRCDLSCAGFLLFVFGLITQSRRILSLCRKLPIKVSR